MYTEVTALNEPSSSVSEAYRTLRTNIQFSSIDETIKTIMVTSAVLGEGKTTTACNLAVMIASGGSRTILVDCDMRRPNVHNMFKVENSVGLADLAVRNEKLSDVVKRTGIENLDVLCAGHMQMIPADFLASDLFGGVIDELKLRYDAVILDTPPVIPVTDAQIVSQHADGCLLVVLAGQVHRSIVLKAKELLLQVNAKMLGTVLNCADESMVRYFSSAYKKQEDSHRQKRMKKRSAKSVFATHH